MTETLFERASQLVELKRFQDAEKHLLEILSAEPDHIDALTLLALCKSELDKHKEAIEIIKQVVGQHPDDDYSLYLYALFLFRDDQIKEAEKMIKNAISFNPYSSGYFGLMAAIKLNQKEWQEALEQADKGLAIDPEDLTCLNIRSTALFKLDKKDEAYTTIHEALNKDPENDFTHANTGWGLLERGDHKKALEHFREALKLNPENDLAKAGLVQGLKAKYFFYRIFLKYALWIGNLKGGAQWAVILGLYFGIRLIRSIADSNPALSPYLYAIVFVYTLFAVSTWIIGPLSNLFLRLNVYGRYALTKEETESSNYVGISLVLGLLGFVSYLFVQDFVFLMIGFFGISMMIPLATMFNPHKESSRKILVTYSLALAGVGLVSIFQHAFTGDAGALPMIYLAGIVAYQWVANAFIIR